LSPVFNGRTWLKHMNLAIVILSAAGGSGSQLLPAFLEEARRRLPSGTSTELVISEIGPPTAAVDAVARGLGARHLSSARSYGDSLRACLAATDADHIVTIEHDLSQSPLLIPALYAARHEGDLVVASRYHRTGYANHRFPRSLASRWGNRFLGMVLDLPVHDFTSSFRLYSRRVAEQVRTKGSGLDVLPEMLVRTHAAGFHIAELPFHHFPSQGPQDEGLSAMAGEILRSLVPLWRLRNSIDCADYDERAFRSRVWFQRSWQRRRYHAIVGMVRECPRVLDIGCGSSQILDGLPQIDGCDVRMNKLRYKRLRGRSLARASVFDLPYPTGRYDAVVFSQVIEHLPRDPRILSEVVRTAKPGGFVVVGTPDYATWWTTIEKVYGAVHPDGYADEHITHYTFRTLKDEVEALGCTLVDHAYVYGAELIMRFRRNG
jgi:SAM-dependent methyltransferase